MIIKFQYLLIGILLIGCSVTTNQLPTKNLYSYSNSKGYFPKEIRSDKYFYADRFDDILKRLDEKNLADKYLGHEIIRLTVIRSFKNHFSISIENIGNEILLTEKETYRDSRTINTGDTTEIILETIKYDSILNKYVLAKETYPIGKNPAIELERKIVNPLIKNQTRQLTTKDWNSIVKMIDDNLLYNMQLSDSIGQGFDGNHFLLETHTSNGYYVVDRWSPRNGRFKEIIDLIINLSIYKKENH